MLQPAWSRTAGIALLLGLALAGSFVSLDASASNSWLQAFSLHLRDTRTKHHNASTASSDGGSGQMTSDKTASNCQAANPAGEAGSDPCTALLPIDTWDRSENWSAVLLADDGAHPHAQFGNQLFTAALSISLAINQSALLLVLPSFRYVDCHAFAQATI